jgi:hypothetical protein
VKKRKQHDIVFILEALEAQDVHDHNDVRNIISLFHNQATKVHD